MKRLACLAICSGLALSAAFAQSVPPDPATPKQPTQKSGSETKPAEDQSAEQSKSKGVAKAAPDAKPARSRAPRSAISTLRIRIEQVDLDEMSFQDALEKLAELTQTNIVVRWNILADAGVDADRPITMHLRNATVAEVLRQILERAAKPERTVANRAAAREPAAREPAARNEPRAERRAAADRRLDDAVGVAAANDRKLAYRAGSEMILISTAAAFAQEMLVRTYEVSDLVHRDSKSPTIQVGRSLDVVESVQPVVGPGAIAFQPILRRVDSGTRVQVENNAYDSDDPDRDRSDNRMAELLDDITSTIEPESWEVNGGPGSIRVFRGKLIVRNSPFVHQALGGPLGDIEGP